jgi:hypothetical protein
MLGAIDQRNVDVFEVFRGRIMNDRRGIGAARRERGKPRCGRGPGGVASIKANPVEESKNEKRQKERRLLREEISLFQARAKLRRADLALSF